MSPRVVSWSPNTGPSRGLDLVVEWTPVPRSEVVSVIATVVALLLVAWLAGELGSAACRRFDRMVMTLVPPGSPFASARRALLVTAGLLTMLGAGVLALNAVLPGY
jgi:hypothetical protein